MWIDYEFPEWLSKYSDDSYRSTDQKSTGLFLSGVTTIFTFIQSICLYKQLCFQITMFFR